jgi:hypothetical protein
MLRVLLALLLLAVPASAQPNCWGPALAATVVAQPDSLQWHTWNQDPGRVYLYRGPHQVGAYDLKEHYYRAYDAAQDKWGDVTTPPITPPCFGVNIEKIAPTPRYSVNGKEVSRETANDVLTNGLTDDSKKLRVTVTGPPEKRKQVADDLRKQTDADSFIVRDYDPKAWEMNCGFKTDGDPTVYCQAPSGKVLHRQDDYQGGADATIAALRKAKAGYDPKKDPDLRKELVPIVPASLNSTLLALGAGLLAMIAVQRTQERNPTDAGH